MVVVGGEEEEVEEEEEGEGGVEMLDIGITTITKVEEEGRRVITDTRIRIHTRTRRGRAVVVVEPGSSTIPVTRRSRDFSSRREGVGHLCPPPDDRRRGRKTRSSGHHGDRMGVAAGGLDLRGAVVVLLVGAVEIKLCQAMLS